VDIQKGSPENLDDKVVFVPAFRTLSLRWMLGDLSVLWLAEDLIGIWRRLIVPSPPELLAIEFSDVVELRDSGHELMLSLLVPSSSIDVL